MEKEEEEEERQVGLQKPRGVQTDRRGRRYWMDDEGKAWAGGEWAEYNVRVCGGRVGVRGAAGQGGEETCGAADG